MKRTLSALVLTGAVLTVTACSDGVPPQLKPQQPGSTDPSLSAPRHPISILSVSVEPK